MLVLSGGRDWLVPFREGGSEEWIEVVRGLGGEVECWVQEGV